MVSKNQIKLITSLQQKKYRKINQMFIVEGKKSIQEFIDTDFELVYLFTTNPIYFKNKGQLISGSDLRKISSLTNANDSLAVFKIPEEKKPEIDQQLILVLDSIQDPGNLGTMIRLADWFGIQNIICSEDTVDVYNPKVIQASMGSLTRVHVLSENLSYFLSNYKNPIYGTFMDGENIYSFSNLSKIGAIVMGNEANGISKEIEKLVTHRISIPRFGNLQITESLNVATASAIIMSEFLRR